MIPYVFPHLEGHLRGTRIKDFKKDRKTASKKAGRPGMLRHDLRRTVIRNLERAGVPRSVTMKNTGHRTESIYRRYGVSNDADNLDAVRRLELPEIHSSLLDGPSFPHDEVLNARFHEGERRDLNPRPLGPQPSLHGRTPR